MGRSSRFERSIYGTRKNARSDKKPQIFVMHFRPQKCRATISAMKFVVFQRLVCLLAVLGIMLGPVSVAMAESAMASSNGMTMSASDVTETHIQDGMLMTSSAVAGEQANVDEMPCCPKAKPVAPGCQKNCPLALICASMILVHPLHGVGERAAYPLVVRYSLLHDDEAPSAEVKPPARPPRANYIANLDRWP